MHPLTHVVISASAGTGKTFQLSNRYLGLLYRGVTPDQILATTFTRKAAGEILDRVIIQLADAVLEPAEGKKLAGWLSVARLPVERCREMLRQMLRQLHRLRVCTLDAFFAQLAGSFSLELGLLPGWRIVEESYEVYLRDEAIARTLQGHSAADVQRLVHLMAKGTAQRSVTELVRDTVESLYSLYMETDARAWHGIPQPPRRDDAEMAVLIQQLRDAPLPDDNRVVKARDRDVAKASAGDWESFIESGLAGALLKGATTYHGRSIPAETVGIYAQMLDQARAVLLQQVAWQTEATYELLDKFHQVYAQLKQQAGAMRFDDVTRALSRDDRLGDLDRQHYRLDTSVVHLLLDEFQDTSLAQWQVLRPLAQRVTSPEAAGALPVPPGPPSFLSVGDAKQAIYAWRGGKSEILGALPQELHGLEAQSLSESWRSSQPVIDVVNCIFRDMTRHPNLKQHEQPVIDWCNRFPEHTTVRGDRPGYVELSTAHQAGDDERAEDAKFSYAAARIEQLAALAPGCSVGVLTRRNDAVKRLIDALRERGVAASEEGGNPLLDSLAGQVILSLLRLADHPGNTIARFHVAQSPLAEHLDYTDHTDDARTAALAQDVRARLLHAGYGRAVERWAEWLEPSCDPHDRSRLRQFVELAYGYQPLATLRTTDFQRYVELKRVEDPTAAGVRVMTVHQAKGLQFDIVVLPDLDAPFPGRPDTFVTGQPSATAPIDRVCRYRNEKVQQLLPAELQALFSEHERQSVDEALCVLYVALTRAIHSLYMIIVPSSERSRSLPKTAAGLLRAALTDGKPLPANQVVYCKGDPRWYEKLPAAPAPAAAGAPVAAGRPVVLAPMREDARREFVAPSQLEGGAQVRAADVLNLGGSAARLRGTLIHALFEQIRWLDDAPPDRAQLRCTAESLLTTGLNIEEQLDAFQGMVAHPDIQAVLRRAFYESPRDEGLQRALAAAGAAARLRVEVHNERRFAVLDEGHILSGSIDRLVLLHEHDRLVAADIVDYKTDAVEPGDLAALERLVEFYRPQLEAYRRAVSAMYRLPPAWICARLLFVAAGLTRAVA